MEISEFFSSEQRGIRENQSWSALKQSCLALIISGSKIRDTLYLVGRTKRLQIYRPWVRAAVLAVHFLYRKTYQKSKHYRKKLRLSPPKFIVIPLWWNVMNSQVARSNASINYVFLHSITENIPKCYFFKRHVHVGTMNILKLMGSSDLGCSRLGLETEPKKSCVFLAFQSQVQARCSCSLL